MNLTQLVQKLKRSKTKIAEITNEMLTTKSYKNSELYMGYLYHEKLALEAECELIMDEIRGISCPN